MFYGGAAYQLAAHQIMARPLSLQLIRVTYNDCIPSPLPFWLKTKSVLTGVLVLYSHRCMDKRWSNWRPRAKRGGQKKNKQPATVWDEVDRNVKRNERLEAIGQGWRVKEELEATRAETRRSFELGLGLSEVSGSGRVPRD